MFTLFSELISFHLQSLQVMERSHATLLDLNRKLSDTTDENRRYEFISNHNLQEPIRKIRIFTEMLVDATEREDTGRSKNLALRINSSAQKISMMIKDLSTLSQLDISEGSFVNVDLNKIISDVSQQLESDIRAKQAIIDRETLPHLRANPLQMEQLFFHLISNAIKFSRKDVSPLIKISATKLSSNEVKGLGFGTTDQKYLEVRVEDNGIGIEKSRLEKIFDIFTQINYDLPQTRFGVGLTYCRKIVRNHGGSVAVHSEPGVGTAFSIIFPAT
jgi:light-regulated signal transduction histidine kinase (bacteriophytochrome)